VVSDGKSVAITNTKLKTADIYPLSKTPLKLLLDDRIDLSNQKVQKVTEDADLTTIVLMDKSVFGNSRITMMFDPKNYELRQWTVTDAQGKDTTVMIFNVTEGAKVDAKAFVIDYQNLNKSNLKNQR
jgi:outer membrane lipoprotein-sorting protein